MVYRTRTVEGLPDAQPSVVGTYALVPVVPKSLQEPREALALQCPYCREKMTMRRTTRQWRRRVGDLGDGIFESVDIPKTHHVVACLPCDARFVVPVNTMDWPESVLAFASSQRQAEET